MGVFDPAAGGETRTLEGGLLALSPTAAADAVVWGPDLAARPVARGREVVGLRLARALPFGGTLRFDRGQGAAGVTVLARRPTEADLVHRTRTDARGVFRFDHVGSGPWEVAVRRGDGRLQSLGTFTAGQPDAERVLVPGSRVEGQILDGDASERTGLGGLSFGLVRLPGSDALSDEPFVTGDDGTFVLDDVPAGVYEARLADDLHFFQPAAPRLEVPARGRVRLRGWFALRARTVEGRVEGPRSARVAGAEVLLLPDATQAPPPGGWPVRGGRADRCPGPLRPDGRAARARLPPRGRRRGVRVDGHGPVRRRRVPREPPCPTVLLASGWRLEVKARAPGGAPLAGIAIHAVPADHPVESGDPGWAALARRGVTDAAGEAVLVDLPEGDVRVLATSPRVTDLRGLVPYPPSGDVRTWTATLFPAASLEGRVEPAGARALPPLVVRARVRGEASARTTRVGPGRRIRVRRARERAGGSRRGGRRRFERSGAGARRGAGPGPVAPRPHHPAGAGRDRRSRARCLRRGPARPRPARGAGLRPRRRRLPLADGGEVRPATDDPHRSWRIEDLSPGPYAVRATQGDNDSGAYPVRLEEGTTEEVELILTDGGRVAGTVLGERDLPLLGAEVRLVRLRGDGDAPGRPAAAPRRATDAAGGYVFEDVAPGIWRVEVRDADGAEDQETLRVAEGESVVVRDLVVGRGGAIEGTVSDGQGRELDGALLVLEAVEEGPDPRSVRTGREGAFRLDGLRAGTWRIRLEARAGPFAGLEALRRGGRGRDDRGRADRSGAGAHPRSRVAAGPRRAGPRRVPDLASGRRRGPRTPPDGPLGRGGAVRLRGPADRRLRGGRRRRRGVVDAPRDARRRRRAHPGSRGVGGPSAGRGAGTDRRADRGRHRDRPSAGRGLRRR